MKMLRVLLADDDEVIGILLEEVLDGLGHEVCAIEATEAGLVDAAARHRPDLMIVDAHLGKGSGVAAVAKILRTDYIPHVFMSGSAVQAVSPDAVVLQKPFWDHDLIQAIERAMGAAAPISHMVSRRGI